MALTEARYTFIDDGTPAAKRMTSERITEFKGYNARGVREDGEMKDMEGLTSDEYPMLASAKSNEVYKEYGAKQILSKTVMEDGAPKDVLFSIRGGKCYRDDTEIPGLELSDNAQMVAINDKICFFPDKMYYSVYQGSVGKIDNEYTTQADVSIGDDTENNRISATLTINNDPVNFKTVFNVGDVVTISSSKSDTQMFTKLYNNEVLWSAWTNFDGSDGPGWIWDGDSFSFNYKSCIAVDLSRLDATLYAQGGITSFAPGQYGVTIQKNGRDRVSIAAEPYTGPFMHTCELKQHSGIRYIWGELVVRKTTTGDSWTSPTGLWSSPFFNSVSEARSWGASHLPTDMPDWEQKKSEWTQITDNNVGLTFNSSTGTFKLDSSVEQGILVKRKGTSSYDIYTLANSPENYMYLNSGDLKKYESDFSLGLNGTTAVIQAIDETKLTFPDNTFHDLKGEWLHGKTEEVVITISRDCPDLDHVIEWNNRLWGCSSKDNTIYASKLGDPTNWYWYQATALDSYAAQQGSNGKWTGVGKYSTHLLFFKPDCVHKVYGNFPSEYQIVTQMCSGVEEGSDKSIVTMEDGVFYKSRRGIMAYTGGIPALISQDFGNDKYKNAVAGYDGNKYYVSMQNVADDSWHTFAFDHELMVWHRLSGDSANDYEWHKGNLLAARSDVIENVGGGTDYVDDWYAVFGPLDEYVENEKIYSVITLRYNLQEGKKLKVETSIDDGEWREIDEVTGSATTGHEIEFIPERCDHFAIRLSGDGGCTIKSLTRDFRVGSVQKENY